MVEMLGVLSIIGVLSVGGVYGYGVAMKKHKANELLHQASMLATDISTKILTGKPLGNITDFGSSSNGTFSETVGTPNDEQFTLQITDVDESVCKQLQSMNGGMVRQVECGTADANGKTTATLKFNNNLSSEPVAGDYNDDTTGKKCTDAGYQWCDGACKQNCCDGVLCSGCQTCNTETGICQNDDSKCELGEECFSGACMGAECANEDCSCTQIGTVSSECSSSRPYCVMDASTYNGECVATAEAAPCWGNPSWCFGTDAPYCAFGGEKCSKTPTGGVLCTEDKHCIDLGYCEEYSCVSN
jgi:type II secretory pathway pseudopilin PulG